MTYSVPTAGGNSVEITLSFLSPITPTSTVRQAIPASYLNVYVTGNSTVSVYVDVNGQWVSGNRGNDIVWNLEDDHTLKSWRVKRRTEQLFTEYQDRAEWGTLYFSAPSDVDHESGVSAELRQGFAYAGTLRNKVDGKYRRIMEEEPVFAFSKTFHTNSTYNSTSADRSTQSVMFTMAHIQDPVVQYASARGLTLMRPLWKAYFESVQKLLTWHYKDFKKASALADDYSAQLAIDAYRSGADDYVDIVALSARQVMGATSFSGTPDNPILFLKEIASNGNFQTIDVIFPSFPFFIYTQPKWLAYLLEPLIEHMLSGQYPRKSAMHDLGAHFPNATGHPDGNDEYMPVEECGDILVMGLALANTLTANTSYRAVEEGAPMLPLELVDTESYIDQPWSKLGSGEARAWIGRSYRMWKQWTQYLVDESLRPSNQLSTDDFAGWLSLQSGLALKGAIGINAMAELARMTGHEKDAKYYQNISTTYIAKWEEYAVSRDKTHTKVAYDWWGSWTTQYNLFADSLLCFPKQHLKKHDVSIESPAALDGQKPIGHGSRSTGFVPKHIYQMHSDWYWNVRQKYGVPLDSRHLYTKTDWEFFAAAVAAPAVRSEILELVAKWVNETETDRPFADLHDTEHRGGFPGPNFFARPVIGGHFAFLTLDKACGYELDSPPNLNVSMILAQELAAAAVVH